MEKNGLTRLYLLAVVYMLSLQKPSIRRISVKRRLISIGIICSVMTVGFLGIVNFISKDSKAQTTWSIETIDSSGEVGSYSSITLDSNGYAHISYIDNDNIYLKYAKWNGSEWNIEIVDAGIGGDVFAWTSIELDSFNHPHISYCDDSNQYLKYAKWNGSGWNIEILSTECDGRKTSIAIDCNDYAHISYWSSGPVLNYTKWNGVSWETETVDTNGGLYSSIALDSSDYPHISYFTYAGEDLKYARWNGSDWNFDIVDSNGRVGYYTSIVLDSNDYPHITHTNWLLQIVRYAKWNGSDWNIEEIVEPNGVGGVPSIGLDNNDFAHICYRDNTTHDLKYTRWNGSNWVNETVDSAVDVASYISIALNSSGLAHISYYDSTDRDLKYAKLILATTPSMPINIIAIPDSWTNINSFIVNWTNSSDESGLKLGAWYKIGSPPINNTDGTWQDGKPITVSSIEGNQTIYLWLEDTLGNKDYNNNASTQLYLDTTPPEPFTPSANPSDWTANNRPEITFSTIDLLSGIDHYEVQIDSGSFSIQTSPYTLPSLIDGTHSILVRAYDVAGNYRDVNIEVQIDTTSPSAPTDVSVTPDNWTNTNSFIIHWINAIETDTSGIKTGCWYKIGSPPLNNSDGIWIGEKPLIITSFEGAQTIYIWLEDNVGNTNYLNYGTITLYLDTTPPSSPLSLGYNIEPHIWTNINSFRIMVDEPPEFGTSGIKNGAWYKIGSPPSSNTDGTWQEGDPITVSSFEGEQVIYVWLEDNVGNVDYRNNKTRTLHLDTTPPSITHTSITNAIAGEPITINATITDNIEVKVATLYYRIPGEENFTTVSMSHEGDNYSAEIPASAVTTDGIEYYISASDKINTAYLPITAPSTQYITIEILYVDGTPPIISHSPIPNGTAGLSITISATIIDDVGVTGATLFYRIKGTSTWLSIPMIQNVNVFSADIPGSAVTLDHVEYYIQATDSIFNTTHPDINPQTVPHEITVSHAEEPDDGEPEPKEDEDFLTTFWWLLLLFFIVVVFLVFLLSRRHEQEEVGIGAITEEEPIAVESEESIPGEITEETPQPEIEEPAELPEESPEPAEDIEELGTIPQPKSAPSPSVTTITDEEIFESIKKKYEEGKISEATFREIEKRYKKE